MKPKFITSSQQNCHESGFFIRSNDIQLENNTLFGRFHVQHNIIRHDL